MRKTNTNLSNYDDFRKYSVEEIGNMFGIGKTKTRELLQSRLLPVTKIGRDYFTSKIVTKKISFCFLSATKNF